MGGPGVWLASTVDQMGDVSGIADLAFVDGKLYALVAGGGCSHGNSTLPNGVVRVDLKSGTWRYLEDLSIFLQEHPPAYNSYNDFEPDGIPYSMTAEHGALFLAEPNHAQIIRVATDGATRLAYDFSYPFADVTPTAIAFRDNSPPMQVDTCIPKKDASFYLYAWFSARILL